MLTVVFRLCRNIHYHDTTGQVVEGGRFQFKVLPPDDGVGQSELKEEGLEDPDFFTWCQTKSLLGQTESLRLPGGDGVWYSEGHVLCSSLSGSTDTQRHTDT